MKLDHSFELERFLPAFMREDMNFQGIIYALEKELKLIFEYVDLIRLYSNNENLPEHILDELAWQFNIVEYEKDYDITIKRELVRGCMALHYKRGTVEAVQEAVEKIFGNATVEEWFDYGGEPYHFKIKTDNISSDDDMIQRVERIVKATQNARSYLEEVVVEIMKTLNLTHGCVITVISDCTNLSFK